MPPFTQIASPVNITEEWTYKLEPSGCICWSCSQHPFSIYATPLFERMPEDPKVIQVHILNTDGDGILTSEIPWDKADEKFWDSGYLQTNQGQWHQYRAIMIANLPLILLQATMKAYNP